MDPPRLRVLLVEDSELNQMVARALLEGEGAAVSVAGDGEQALAILRRQPDFDLVLMDVQMPVLDGLAATRLIRSELKLALPVIAMSACALASERAQCIAAGMNGFIAKPLEAALLSALAARHAPAAAGPPCAGGHMAADVFDVAALAALNERHPERRKQLAAMVERALAGAEAQLGAACAACLRGEYGAAASELHQLRGALGTLGARRFVSLSMQIEAALGDGAADSVLALFDQAEREVRRTVECGQAWLAAGAPAPGG